uniref:Beta-lactamase domain protein n=1 Tax=uncultured marine crenarchaeote E48-1C TaxID=907718 RepID=G9BAU9_9ARCH|nr:beta-lactamase domain protein [uncultured marine crenarchaeote E48-1C]
MSIEKQIPGKGEILFVWFNRYSGVTIKTPSKILVIDPVDVKPRELKNVDAILITHEHYDHLDQPLLSEIHKLAQCKVVADPTSIRRLQNNISPENLHEVQPGSEVSIGKVSIKAEECNHQPAATPVTFIITSEDGVKIYHTADSLPFPEMETIGKREKLDVAFCTVGIAPGTTPETGLEIIKLTKPKVAVPYHTASTSDQDRFSELLTKDMPRVKCLIPEVGKIYQVFKRKGKIVRKKDR